MTIELLVHSSCLLYDLHDLVLMSL